MLPITPTRSSVTGQYAIYIYIHTHTHTYTHTQFYYSLVLKSIVYDNSDHQLDEQVALSTMNDIAQQNIMYIHEFWIKTLTRELLLCIMSYTITYILRYSCLKLSQNQVEPDRPGRLWRLLHYMGGMAYVEVRRSIFYVIMSDDECDWHSPHTYHTKDYIIIM